MKKLVCESLHEFRSEQINEGLLDSIKKSFKKIGKFFKNIFGDGAILPVNIGIMVKNDMLNTSAISYIPSTIDLSMESNLKTLTENKLLKKRKLNESIKENINEAIVDLEHPDKNVPSINAAELIEEIDEALFYKGDVKAVPLLIWGAPGIGKTEIVKMVLKQNKGGRLIDVQTSKMMPDDWSLPVIFTEPGKRPEALDIPKTWLPAYVPTGDEAKDRELNEAANLGNGGILFLDELSRAEDPVLNTCLKLVNERIVGDAMLGDKWVIIAAANRMDDEEEPMNWSSALGDRFNQINYVPDYENWVKWASKNNIDQRIIDFLEFNRQYFYTLDPAKTMFATPRSWAAASTALGKYMSYIEAKDKKGEPTNWKRINHKIASAVGEDIALQLIAFLKLLESITPEDIRKVLTDPENARLPKKTGGRYDIGETNALISIICTQTIDKELTPSEFENYCKYLVKLDDNNYGPSGFKKMINVHPEIESELGQEDDGGHVKYVDGKLIFLERYSKAMAK